MLRGVAIKPSVWRPILTSLSLRVLVPSLVHSSTKKSQKLVQRWQASSLVILRGVGHMGMNFGEPKELSSGMSD